MALTTYQLHQIGIRLGQKYTTDQMREIFTAALSEQNWHPAANVIDWMLRDWERAEVLEEARVSAETA